MNATIKLLVSFVITLSNVKSYAAAEKQLPIKRIEITGHSILTDNNGVVIPKQVLELTAGVAVKIKRIDGFEYQGVVTEVEESEGILKIFGVMVNSKKTHFGFVAVKGGNFVGAIIDEAKNETYIMEFIAEAKGYMFVRELTEKTLRPKI